MLPDILKYTVLLSKATHLKHYQDLVFYSTPDCLGYLRPKWKGSSVPSQMVFNPLSKSSTAFAGTGMFRHRHGTAGIAESGLRTDTPVAAAWFQEQLLSTTN